MVTSVENAALLGAEGGVILPELDAGCAPVSGVDFMTPATP